MLPTIERGPLSLDAYEGIAPPRLLEQLRRVAEPLRGARILHLNATAYGGGVSELLGSVVPLLRDLGIDAEWKVMGGDAEFFRVTKSLHNALQGAADAPDRMDLERYRETTRRNAELIDSEWDLVFVHDPQPAGVPSLLPSGDTRWVWRCHIDTSSPNPAAWEFLRPYLEPYDAAVFTLPQFVPSDIPVDRVEVVPPAIDPLSPKNLTLPDELARRVLSWIGIRTDRPLVTQVARFDPWKDPIGVIEAVRIARRQVPDLQLALVGSMALDDPEGSEVFEIVEKEARRDPDTHVFTNLTGVGNIEVNAFQRLSDVAVQKSLREGFGLVVAEALWKGTPVVGGRAGGIPLQIGDGDGGILVDDVESCAEAILELMSDRESAVACAGRGRERVREFFLLPRLLLNHLALACELLGADVSGHVARDPNCGIAIPLPGAIGDDGHSFCSVGCRSRFLDGSSEDAA